MKIVIDKSGKPQVVYEPAELVAHEPGCQWFSMESTLRKLSGHERLPCTCRSLNREDDS